MAARLWLVPLHTTPALLGVTAGVLERRAIGYTVVGVSEARARLASGTPLAALIHGGTVSPALMDVQRWFVDAEVPTLILAQGLTDLHESVLLDRGAHEVLEVPASPRRLGSRIEAMVRTLRAPSRRRRLPLKVSVGQEIEVVPSRRSVTVDRDPLDLSKSEFDLLLALALRAGEVVTRDELARATGARELSSRALESHISRLRVKLRAAGAPDRLEAVRGVGYRLADD